MKKQFTLKEYKDALISGYQHPNPEDLNDPGYYMKYAHTMPPMQLYMLRPAGYEKASQANDPLARQVFNGWNNLSEYEEQQLVLIKEHMRDVLKLEMPPMFEDREWLKFLQACKHDIDATGRKISVHW